MAASDKIKEMAHEEAFKYYFCNFGEDDWPDDPDAFMDKVESKEDEYGAAELQYEDEKNEKRMDIWEPFQHCSIGDILWLMDDFETALLDFYQKARKLDEE